MQQKQKAPKTKVGAVNIRPWLVYGVPIDLKNNFKASCAKRGISMSARIRFFMAQCIREDM